MWLNIMFKSIRLAEVFNTLTADEEYSHCNRENLSLPIQMQLLKKSKNFGCKFNAFLESLLNFEHFEVKFSSFSLF